MFAAVPASVVVSASRAFCRRRLIINHTKTALKPTVTTAVRDTDKPATSPLDSSFSATIASALVERLPVLPGCVSASNASNANEVVDEDIVYHWPIRTFT